MKKLKFLVICLFFLLSGCLSKKNPIEVITRIFPKKVSIPLKNLDKKFWFALINGSPIESGKYFVNCFHFKDISKNDITWASTVYNPRYTTATTARIENKTYKPIPEVDNNKVNIYFETEVISGVKTVVSDYFILYVDVEGDYFNEKNKWGGDKISKFLFPKSDFIKSEEDFSGKTIAQLVVLADYEEDAKGDKIKLNWAQSVYVDDFPLLKLEEKIEKIKKVLIARNKGFIKSGSIFESLWVEHRAVSEDDELISEWKVESDAIGGSLKNYDCGVTYDSKGKLVN